MADRPGRKSPKASGAKKPAAQRAAKPKAPAKPKPQRAATPSRSSSAPRRSSRPAALPPLTQDLIDYFGGDERLRMIAEDCVPPDATPSDVLRLLLEARRLKADPLRRDVYLARGMSRDGAGTEYSVAARRDALLAYAERQPDFRGFDADAVYDGDSYERTEPQSEGTLRQRAGVEHRKPSRKIQASEGRGELLFAWCAVDREGRPPLVFEALASEYLPEEDVAAMDPEDPRKRYPDRYLVKVAMCWPLRMVFGLNDVVGAEELTKRPEPLPKLDEPQRPVFEQGPRDELDERIFDAFRQAQALDPLLWPPAKVSAYLASAKASADAGGGDPAVLDGLRVELAEQIEAAVAAEVARRHDPVKLARRLKELREFDPSDLDEDAKREYDTERAAVEAVADALGVAAA